jgi:hypothetical protein
MELIKICRELSVVAEQSPNQDHLLQGVLGACDTAINKSARRRNNVVGPIKQAIKDAIRELIEYGREYHPSNGTIEPRMEVAKNEDKNSSTRRIDFLFW